MYERRILGLILALFILLGSVYALVTPVFEASDELWHYPMIQHLAAGNPLPVQVWDPAQAGPWKQEASQPPLYYYVGAALTFWIDTADMAQIRALNPHVDNGLITADGNINLVVHNPDASPWQGTLLAVRIVRLASVLMAATTVYLTYRIAHEVAPDRPEIALGAAAVNAFTPMFLFISGAVNNDNLAIPLASLAVFLMIYWTVRRGWTRGRWLLLGAVIGLAVLTKEGTLGLIPLALGSAVFARWQAQGPALRWRNLPRLLVASLGSFLWVLLPVLLIAGWWYYRNVALYGDWLGWNAFIAVLGERPQAATLSQLWGERHGFLMSYWGLFGGVNVPMWSWIYTVLNAVLLAAILGFLIYLLQLVRQAFRAWPREVRFLVGFVRLVEAHFPLLVSLLFSAAVIYGLVNWATTTWSSQGRLVFTAISTLTTLLLVGLVGWLPRRPASVVVTALTSFLLLVAVAAPFLWIRPAYTASTYLSAGAEPALQPAAVRFGRGEEVPVRLAGYRVDTDTEGNVIRPGDAIDVYLAWEVLTEMEEAWSVFVHLNDPVLNTPLAQRDMYPGQGTLSTRFLEPGERIVNRYRLRVPQTTVAPATLEVVTGLYRFDTGERLPAEQGDSVLLATLEVAAAPGTYPNATSINLGNQVELVGYLPEPRWVGAGEQIALTLYWRALRPLDVDYTFFAQVLDNEDTTRWASDDVPGVTTEWAVGEVRTVTMTLPVSEAAPAGVYPLVVGAYTQTDTGGFKNLQRVEDGRITMDRYLTLTRIRVDR